jgi:riboflavin kinase/FMN adenylyltransferase
MTTISSPAELPPDARGVSLAIGVFDGVHLGHQQVIRQTISDARDHEALAVVVTFDRHPNAIVAPQRVPPSIYSQPQKLRAIAALSADVAWVIRFDRDFSEQTGERFVRQLARDFRRIFSICVGATFTFGHRRSGNVELLRRLGGELGFAVHGLAAVALDDQIVSSTRIREAIKAGHLDAASQMLGRSYALAGEVIRGDGLGRELGFPTANLEVTGLVLPPSGVYAARAAVGGHSHRAVVNIGVRPTLARGEPRVRVEAHLLDFSGDLYGQEVELTFADKLRDERKFPSRAALQTQIGDDIASARKMFWA